jgi:branched-subunit amino acid transport protein
MSAAWATVIAVGGGTAVLKAVGPVVVGGRPLPPRLLGLLSMLAPALLAALVIDEGFASGRSLVLDARVAGLAAGASAVMLRAPIWAVVVAGAAATALVRLLL